MEALDNLLGGTALPDVLFYVFAALTLLCGVLVIANPFSRNPVTSAMFLVLTIISMAGLFVLLHAFFLAAVQILVYAGAVIVLFLFVIMLLDLKEEQRRKIKMFGIVAGLLLLGQTTSADANQATSYTLISIASVILGGGEFVGGKIYALGSVFGALTMTLATSFLNFYQVSSDWQVAMQGIILIVALSLRTVIGYSGKPA